MSLKDLWNILRKKDPRANHVFTEEDQKKAQEIKQAQHEIKIKRLEAERARAEYELAKYESKIQEEMGELDDDDEGGEQMLLNQFMTVLNAARSPQQNGAGELYGQSPPTVAPAPQVVVNDLSDDDIRAFIKAQPKMYVKMAKKAPKNIVIQQAMQKMGLTEAQALRAYDILSVEF